MCACVLAVGPPVLPRGDLYRSTALVSIHQLSQLDLFRSHKGDTVGSARLLGSADVAVLLLDRPVGSTPEVVVRGVAHVLDPLAPVAVLDNRVGDKQTNKKKTQKRETRKGARQEQTPFKRSAATAAATATATTTTTTTTKQQLLQ